MNKKVTWITIVLMSCALVGISFIQIYWLRYSLNLNEVKFEQNVGDALYNISNKLEIDELNAENSRTIDNLGSYILGRKSGSRLNDKKLWSRDDLRSSLLKDTVMDWLEIGNLRSQYSMEDQIGRLFNTMGWQERIDIDFLDKLVQVELESRNIFTRYSYGIYSFQDSCIVMMDGHFTACAGKEESTPFVTFDESAQASLANTPYKVKLYRSGGIGSPGELLIFFPARRSVIWEDALSTALWSVLFMAIILFCFIYTITVIIKQKRISEMKNDFINNMTHEFKTPIATISLAVDSINSPMIAGQPDKVTRFAEIIKQENKRMLGQVEKVLQMAQIEKEDMQLKIAEVDLHDLILKAAKNFDFVIQGRDGKLALDLKAENSILQADQTHMSNMIHNLLDNANKYSPESPQITITTKNRKNGVVLTIKDQGIGMKKEVVKNIFDRFYRVHTGNLHDVKGFGLGLSYVKAMVNAHKGEILVKSEPGVGSQFSLFFPFKQAV